MTNPHCGRVRVHFPKVRVGEKSDAGVLGSVKAGVPAPRRKKVPGLGCFAGETGNIAEKEIHHIKEMPASGRGRGGWIELLGKKMEIRNRRRVLQGHPG